MELHRLLAEKVCLALLFSILSGCAQKKDPMVAHNDIKLPQDLVYQSQPISNAIMATLLCLGGPGTLVEGIDLDEYAQFEKDGEITDPNTNGSEFYWNYKGTLAPNYHIVSAYEWPQGAMGKFTSISLITREGNTLKVVESIYGGDRHASMIQGLQLRDNNSFTYTQNMTPGWLYEKLMKQYPELEELAQGKTKDRLLCGEADYIGLATFEVTFDAKKGLHAELVAFRSPPDENVYEEAVNSPEMGTLSMGDALLAAIDGESNIQNNDEIPHDRLKAVMTQALQLAKSVA